MKRIEWLDIAKGIGMILVVLGHTRAAPNPIVNFIYAFHMPLFFFISGYLFSLKNDLLTFIRKKTFALLVPYFTFALGTYLFWVLIGRNFGEDAKRSIDIFKPLVGILYSNGVDDWLIFNSPLWFLTCLFVVEVSFYVICKYAKKNIAIFLVLVLLSVAGYVYSLYAPLRLPWSIDVALTAMFFYGIGYLVKSNQLISKLESNVFIQVSLSLLCFIAIYSMNLLNGRVDMNTMTYGNYAYFYIAALLGILMIVLLSQLAVSTKWLTYIGKNTLIIMTTHFLVLTFIKGILVFIFKVNLATTVGIMWAVIYTVGVLLITAPFMFLFNKHFSFLLGRTQPRITLNQ